MNKEIMRKVGFGREVDLVSQSKCPICGAGIKIDDFRDVKSIKECKISGLCQTCQDNIFKEET